TSRKLLLVKPVKGDSVLRADVRISNEHPYKYADFPLDTSKETETLLLYEDSILIGRQTLHVRNKPQEIKLYPDTLDVSPKGYNSWDLKMPDSTIYFISTSVTD